MQLSPLQSFGLTCLGYVCVGALTVVCAVPLAIATMIIRAAWRSRR